MTRRHVQRRTKSAPQKITPKRVSYLTLHSQLFCYPLPLAVGRRRTARGEPSAMAIVYVLVAPIASSVVARRGCRAGAASSSAASGVDLKALQASIDKVSGSVCLEILEFDEVMHLSWAVLQKSSDDVKQALDQLRELGWAKRWSSQPYVSRRTVSGGIFFSSVSDRSSASCLHDACIIFSCVCSCKCNFCDATIMYPSIVVAA